MTEALPRRPGSQRRLPHGGRRSSKAVSGVSFDLDRDETLAIVGESGSGKSVTSQAIMGLINRKAAQVGGEVWLDGVDLIAATDDDIRGLRGSKMAMIFQDPLSSLHPVLHDRPPDS